MTLATEQGNRLSEYARAMREDPLRHIVIPDLLPATRALELSAQLAMRTSFDHTCGLVPTDPAAIAETKGRHVTLAQFQSAPAKERFWRMGSTRFWSYQPGQRRLDETCPFTMSELADLLEFFRAVSGDELGMIRIAGRRHADGCFVGPHSENRLGRILCGHLFLTPGWLAADCGGYLELGSGGDKPLRIDPGFNSVAIFDVRAVARKAISRVTAPAPLHEIQFWCYATAQFPVHR